jgi:hypothetical protein
MRKTGRGSASSRGPSFCLYSPKCVEVEFCELRHYGVFRSSQTGSLGPLFTGVRGIGILRSSSKQNVLTRLPVSLLFYLVYEQPKVEA